MNSSNNAIAEPPAAGNRRRTSHLKDVPPTLELRTSMRSRCADVASRMGREVPLTKDEMETVARELLTEADLPLGYLGWTMVMLSSEFWRPSLAAVPPSRRLFLLPHCLKHAEGCPAEYDQFGLNCKECGACSIADYRGLAEEMGYRVLVAEGSPVVMKIIVGGYVDAVIGVACLNVLEKAIDKVLLAGIPCMAVPLLSSDCRNTQVDPQWVNEMIRTPYQPQTQSTRTYVHLLRAANQLFDDQNLNEVAPRVRNPTAAFDVPLDSRTGAYTGDSIAATETIAFDFLRRGGKHSRPFITLAAYDAMTGGDCTADGGAAAVDEMPLMVRRAAASIETFHKASLVHDDIEDGDAVRYGVPAVHQQYGLATAINIGDYLIGLGYRLLSGRDETQTVDPVARVDVLDSLAAAHLRLAEGQGAELIWRDGRGGELTPLDALKFYALKTSPAFEAALYAGIRLGIAESRGSVAADASIGNSKPLATNPSTGQSGEQTPEQTPEQYRDIIRTFARNLGVGFQIINDINDFYGDADNKGHEAGDLIGGRPTLLWALALENLRGDDRAELLSLRASNLPIAQRIATGRRLYRQSGVIETALRLVDKHQSRAEAAADSIAVDPLRRLMYFLVDTVLQRPGEDPHAPKSLVAIGSQDSAAVAAGVNPVAISSAAAHR